MKVTKMTFLKDKLRKCIGDNVTYRDVMERIYNKTRGQKNTNALITAAKQHKGLIVCHTREWADQIKKMHNVDAVVYTDSRIHSFEGPILMDLPTMWEFVKGSARLQNGATELLDFMDQKQVD